MGAPLIFGSSGVPNTGAQYGCPLRLPQRTPIAALAAAALCASCASSHRGEPQQAKSCVSVDFGLISDSNWSGVKFDLATQQGDELWKLQLSQKLIFCGPGSVVGCFLEAQVRPTALVQRLPYLDMLSSLDVTGP